MDTNEYALAFLDGTKEENIYRNYLAKAVVHGAVEFNESSAAKEPHIVSIFALLPQHMVLRLQKGCRKEPYFALSYWKIINKNIGIVIPVSLYCICKACVPAKNTDTCESVLRDFGCLVGNDRQSQFTGTLDMTEIIRYFVKRTLSFDFRLHICFIHAIMALFCKLVQKVSLDVFHC